MGDAPFLKILPPAVRPDPYPLYDQMLRYTPVSLGPDGLVVVTRHADCTRLLRDPRLSTDFVKEVKFRQMVESGALGPDDLAAAEQRWFVFRDPPDHTRLRKLAAKAFIRRSDEEVLPRIESIATELLRRAVDAGDGQVDLMSEFALPLPMRIISEVIGLPLEDLDRIHEWGLSIGRQMDPVEVLAPEEHEAVTAAHVGMIAYFDELIEKRRSQPTDDLISRLIAVEEEDDHLTTAEINSICRIMLVAGYLTTVSLITSGVMALLRNPGELDRLRTDPSLAATAVDEVLRYDPPFQYLVRVALEDLEIGDHTLEAGHTLILLVAAANRDPERYTDPQRFDIGRSDNPHLSLGAGLHTCLAGWLARLEGRAALNAVAQHLVDPQLVEDPPPYRRHVAFRAPETLSVAVRDLAPA